MKLIRIFIAFVVVSLIVGLGSAFNGKSVPESDTTKSNQIEQKSQDKVENNTQNEEKIEESNSKDEDLSTNTVEKEKIYQSKRQAVCKKKKKLLNQHKNKLKKI